jgi:hypothetical protein
MRDLWQAVELTHFIWAPILLSMGLGYYYGSIAGWPKIGIVIGLMVSVCIFILIAKHKWF